LHLFSARFAARTGRAAGVRSALPLTSLVWRGGRGDVFLSGLTWFPEVFVHAVPWLVVTLFVLFHAPVDSLSSSLRGLPRLLVFLSGLASAFLVICIVSFAERIAFIGRLWECRSPGRPGAWFPYDQLFSVLLSGSGLVT
jgi:hypothetical protein